MVPGVLPLRRSAVVAGSRSIAKTAHEQYNGRMKALCDGKLPALPCPAFEAGMTVMMWTFEGVHQYFPKEDSGGVFRLGMRYIAILRALVAD